MYEQIARNRRASWLLIGFIVVILCGLGYIIGLAVVGTMQGSIGFLGLFGIFAIGWSIIGYYSGDKMVLAASGAHRVSHEDEPRLFNIVEEMTIAGGLPKAPDVYVIEDQAPNAFATGRDPAHASIAVTRGLMELMNREELQGVIAHEMSHVRNYDIRFATLVGILVGVIALISDFFLRSRIFGGFGRNNDSGGAGAIIMIAAIVLAILAPIAAYMVQFAISRRREYLADATGVELTRNPVGLASALQKIAAHPQPLRHANRATAHLYIANPLKKTKTSSGLFDTHPPIQERINILLAMAHEQPSAIEGGETTQASGAAATAAVGGGAAVPGGNAGQSAPGFAAPGAPAPPAAPEAPAGPAPGAEGGPGGPASTG